jgi:hypothetical protein
VKNLMETWTIYCTMSTDFLRDVRRCLPSMHIRRSPSLSAYRFLSLSDEPVNVKEKIRQNQQHETIQIHDLERCGGWWFGLSFTTNSADPDNRTRILISGTLTTSLQPLGLPTMKDTDRWDGLIPAILSRHLPGSTKLQAHCMLLPRCSLT